MIAQFVFANVLSTNLAKVERINTESSERKEEGFGSTEKKAKNTKEPNTKKSRSGVRSRSRKTLLLGSSPQLPTQD